MSSARFSAVPALSGLVLGLVPIITAACGDSANEQPAATGTRAPDVEGGAVPAESGDGCASTGTGTLALTAKGLPDGAKAKATIEGPEGKREVDVPGSIPSPGGSYSISFGSATTTDGLVRTAFTAGPATTKACLKDGATANVEVTYSAIPSSGRLWMLTGDRVSGFASAKLSVTSTQKVESLTVVTKPTGLAFERDGSVWIAAGSTLRHYPAGVFGKEGDQLPDVTLDVPAKADDDTAPPIGGLAFDRDGNLFYSACWEGKVRRIASADLRASGQVTKYLTFGTLEHPGPLAFDGAGNLWVVDDSITGAFKRFSAAGLVTSQETADFAVSPHGLTGDPATNRLLSFSGIAFDATGNLWALGEMLVRLTPADLANSDPTPSVQINVLAGTEPNDRLAFDESGGLWFSHRAAELDGSAPTFARLSPSQLAQSSAEPFEPERDITVDPKGFQVTRQLAFFPAPPGLNIYGTVP